MHGHCLHGRSVTEGERWVFARPSLDIINLKEVVSDAWSLFAWALFNVAPKKKRDHVVNIEEARVNNDLFRKARFVQVNYVEGGSLKRIFLLDGQLKHIHTLA
jgi:hypothetical protein